MLELDEQLRTYFDATALAVDTASPGEADVVVLFDERPVRRGRWRGLLAAAAVIAIVGLAGFVLFRDADGPTNVDDDSVVDQPDPGPVQENVPVELDWTLSGYSLGQDTAVIVSDGERFFAIGSGVDSSLDGTSWENAAMQNMPAAESLVGTWTDSAAAAGRVLHLVVREGEASVFLFDAAAGEVHEATLPFGPVPADDLRGFVALNDQGEAVALLYDLGAPTPMPTSGFFSADGVGWELIPDGQLPAGLILETVALGDGFLANDTWPSTSSTYWHSPDGAQWTAIEAGGVLESLLPWGDIVVASGTGAPSDDGPPYQLTAVGSMPLDADLSPLDVFGFFPVVAAGEVGLAGVAPTGHPNGDPPPDGTWYINYSPDGITWIRQTLPLSGDGSQLVEVTANADRVLVRADGEIWIGVLS